MDFETGGSGRRNPDESSRQLFGGDASGPASRSSGGSGGEFSTSDPVGSFVGTVARVLARPSSFFRGMSRSGGYLDPTIFAVVCGVISSLLAGILGLSLGSLIAGAGMVFFGGASSGGASGLVLGVVLSPVYTVVGVAVTAGVYHLLVLALARSSNAGFEATYRVVCYVSAIQLLSWVPILNIVVLIYGLYVAYFGIREVHATTNQRAAAVVALPVLAVILLSMLFGVLLAAALSAGR